MWGHVIEYQTTAGKKANKLINCKDAGSKRFVWGEGIGWYDSTAEWSSHGVDVPSRGGTGATSRYVKRSWGKW